MNRKQTQRPPDLFESLVKRETIVFIGGDLIQILGFGTPEDWPENFVNTLAQKVSYPADSTKTFFKVSEYAKSQNSNRWVVSQIKSFTKNSGKHANWPALVALAATRQRLT